ncbi:hypothetical protein, partial [Micromonospora sp. NPDC051296]|uniref:hypothetical protein n=1 Tax=Micromonospora sp. NPDC051296 TaxID=3155046 RepID=UPI0034330028
RSLISVWQTAGAGPARRCYQLTAKGRDDLRAWTVRLAQLDQVIDACLRRSAGALQAARSGAADRFAAARR